MELYGFTGDGGVASYCGIEIARHDVGGATVVLTERPDPPGTSVTNAIAALATRVRHDRLADLAPENVRWIEHDPARGSRASTFDEVTLDWDPRARRYHLVRWRRLTPDEIRQLGFEPDAVDLVTGELVRRGIAVEHEGADVRIDGYAVDRHELRALVSAARGDVEDFLQRVAKMRQLFE